MLARSLFGIKFSAEADQPEPVLVTEDSHYRDLGERFRRHHIGFLCVGWRVWNWDDGRLQERTWVGHSRD